MENQINTTSNAVESKGYKPSVILFLVFGFVFAILSGLLIFRMKIPLGGADNLNGVIALLIIFSIITIIVFLPIKYFFRLTWKEVLWRLLFFFLGFISLPVAAGLFLGSITLS